MVSRMKWLLDALLASRITTTPNWNWFLPLGKLLFLFRIRQEVGLSEDFLVVCFYNIWKLYDPVHEFWIALPNRPSKITGLMNFGILSASQKIFVIGDQQKVDPLTVVSNHNLSTNEVWSFDFVARTWSKPAPMLAARSRFGCCIVEGKIFVAGGFTSMKISTSKAEMYDPDKDIWTALPDLHQTHNSTCSGWVIGEEMHIMYEQLSTVQVFDSLKLKWRVADYGWLLGPKVVVRDSLYVMDISTAHIVKQDKRDRQIVGLPSLFSPWLGGHMGSFRDQLYVIGGVFHGRYEPLESYMHFLIVRDDKPAWDSATLCYGFVYGCAELRI